MDTRVDAVAVEPLWRCARLLVILLPWLFVLVGRRVCVVAQRVPPLVWVVHSIVVLLQARRSARAARAWYERSSHLAEPGQTGCPWPQHRAVPALAAAHRLDDLEDCVRR